MTSDETILSRIGRAWRNAVRDVVLIVVSILIAFMLDAWWDGRQERRREEQHLAAIGREFGAIRRDLQEDHREVLQALAATRSLLGEMGQERSIESDSLGKLFNTSYDAGIDAPPRGGALSAILASGDIRLIRDDSLAYMFAQWPLIADELMLDQALLTANREQDLRSRLMALGIPESAIASNLGDYVNLPPTRFPFDGSAVLRDPGIESLLVARLIRLRNIEDRLEVAFAHIDRMLERMSVAGALPMNRAASNIPTP